VATRSKGWFCCRLLADIVVPNPAGAMDVCLLLSAVFMSGRGLCDGLITRSEGVLLSVVCLSVIAKTRKVKPWLHKTGR